MNKTRVSLVLRSALLALSLGAITSAIFAGAILLAVFNLPEEILAAGENTTTAGIGVIVVAASLSTAPLIEWWYNHLVRWLNVFPDSTGGDHENENQS